MIDSIVKYIVGKLRIIGGSDGSIIGNISDALKTVHAEQTSTGTITTSGTGAGSNVELALQSVGSAQVQISGTFSGATMVVEGTTDGSTWVTLFTSTGSGGTYSTAAFSNTGKYRVYRVPGLTKIRVRATALASGSVSVFMRAVVPINWIEAMISGQYLSTLPILTDGAYAPIQIDSNGRVLISGNVSVSAIPAVSIPLQASINAATTIFNTYTAAQRLAIKQFYAGGTGIGKQVLYRYVPATAAFVTSGDFETAGDIGTIWNWQSTAGTGSIASSSTQTFSGTKSVQLTFSNSSGNNAQSIKQTFSSPVDYSVWRAISAQFYNVVSSGGAYTRTISIVLTDSNGSTRTWSTSGLSTSAPFNASGWIAIGGDLLSPTASSGTSFDATSIAGITLTLNDSANKTGVVYWDTVKLIGALTPIFPIYHLANVSFNVNIDPVTVLEIGDEILVTQTNNDTVRKEYFALVGTVTLV